MINKYSYKRRVTWTVCELDGPNKILMKRLLKGFEYARDVTKSFNIVVSYFCKIISMGWKVGGFF